MKIKVETSNHLKNGRYTKASFMGRKPDYKNNLNKENQTELTKKDSDEDPNIIAGLFFLIICLLLFLWRGASFVEDLSLLTHGDTAIGIVEQRIAANSRKGVQAQILYSFTYGKSKINGESRMFEPLMIITSNSNENDQQVFTVIYDPTEIDVNYPKAEVWAGFIISLITLLFALLNRILSIKMFLGVVFRKLKVK